MKYTPDYWKDVSLATQSIPGSEELFGKTVMITGINGMICSSVADILLNLNKEKDAGIKVIAAARSEEKVRNRFAGFGEEEGLYFVHYDAASLDPIDVGIDVDFIIHGASNANPAAYMREPVETMMANISGLQRMLELARDKNADRILYVSSSEVYGMNDTMDPYKEDTYGFLDILSERAGYPSSKRAGESLCVAYGMEYGVDAVMVRPGHIYGPTIQPQDNRASAEFTRNALAGEDIVMKSKGTQLRSYCYTLDCASAMLSVLLKGEKSNAYNISNPNSICTISDIAHAIAEAAGVKVIFQIASEEEQKGYSPMSNSSLCSDKLESLGWIPRFDLETGVTRMINTLK